MEHSYVSTACEHGLHGRCRRTCKFCDSSCICLCHRGVEAEVSAVDDARAVARILWKSSEEAGIDPGEKLGITKPFWLDGEDC